MAKPIYSDMVFQLRAVFVFCQAALMQTKCCYYLSMFFYRKTKYFLLTAT